MIYLIPNYLLIFVEADNDRFLKDLLEEWSKGKELLRYDLKPPVKNFFKRKLNGLRNLITIRKLITSATYQLIYFEWGSTLLRRVTNLFKINKPVVTRMQRYELFENQINKVHYDKVSNVILVSEFIKQKFLARFPKLRNKVIIIPNLIKLNKFSPDPNKIRTYKICTLSYLTERKRIDLVIDAMKQITNPKVKLHIAGSGELKEELGVKVREEKLDNKIFFDGEIKDVQNWLKDKDIVINSSMSEGLPFSVIEAMACCVIPLVRNWGGADAIFPKEFVLPFNESEFIDDLARNINELYEIDDKSFESKRISVRAFVDEKYSFEKNAQRFEQLFDSLIKKTGIEEKL